MSKITTAKKQAKLKGKAAKTAEAMKAKKSKNQESGPTESAISKLPNYGKCCTCQFYANPCRKTNEYTSRKAEKTCYKMKD